MFLKPTKKIYQHLYFNGVFSLELKNEVKIRLHSYGEFIENELFWEGINKSWEGMSLQLWQELAINSQTILDIGAHNGIYALVAKGINQQANVYAFEPSTIQYERLKLNNLINEFDIKCINKAVSNSDGENIIENVWQENKKVSTISMEKFVEENMISNIDLVKIDVEFFEDIVLESFSSYLSRFKPSLLIEVLSDEMGFKLQQIVQNIGYIFFDINELQQSVNKVSEIKKSSTYNYLICMPEVAKKLTLI